jgi:two-component system chemotaxis sensor kinase CheA
MPRRDAELKARLLATFRVEAEEHLGALSANLLALGEAPGGERGSALVEATFREMHTLKGAARSVGLRDVEQVCAACEALLSAIKRARTPPVRAVLAPLEDALDAVARLLAGEPAATAELVTRLERAVSAPGDSAPPAPPREPAPVRTAPGTIRLAAADLDVLLRRAEELLAIKLTADDWVLRAEALVVELRRLRTERDVPELRAVEAGARSMLSRLRLDRRTIATTVDGLLDETRRVRMMPASTVLDVFPRMVRDVAEGQGKEAEWVVAGRDLEVDRRVLETIKDPLLHLVRNALDHGLEPPDARVAAGKPRRGRIAVSMRSLEGGRVEIVVSDDGRGIDPARVRDAAKRARVAVAEDAEPLELIFRSGLSTSFVITDVSGHGLGLAIVKEQVERLGGQVTVESRLGAGTAVRLVVPATIATFRGLLVRAAGDEFLISLEAVERVVPLADDEPVFVDGREAIRHGGEVLPCAPLDALLELERSEAGSARTCAVVTGGGERAAIRVDEVVGEREVLVKDFTPPLVRVRNVAGAGLLGAGELVLVLRPADLVRGVRTSRPARREARAAVPVPPRAPAVLVVDDAVTTRAMERGLLEMAGYRVSVAVDGLDAWTTLRTGEFDLVVSDVDMPRMDGFELTARIRADERLADLPVVLVSALEARADKERGIEVGANAYVVKSSFERSNLLDIIRRLGVRPLEGGRV